jgi:hypothetical protein
MITTLTICSIAILLLALKSWHSQASMLNTVPASFTRGYDIEQTTKASLFKDF